MRLVDRNMPAISSRSTRIPGATGLSWGQALRGDHARRRRKRSGLGGEIGSLRPGRRADVVVWDGDPLELSTGADAGLDRRRRAAAAQPPDRAPRPLRAPAGRRAAEGVRTLTPFVTRLSRRPPLLLRERSKVGSGSSPGMTKMGALAQVIIATAAFVGTHILLSHPLRAPWSRGSASAAFAGIYSLVGSAPPSAGWSGHAGAWRHELVSFGSRRSGGGRRVAVMLVASILLVGALIGNPALPGAVQLPNGDRAACSRSPAIR